MAVPPNRASGIRRIGRSVASLMLGVMLGAADTPPGTSPDIVARRGAITLTAADVKALVNIAEPALRAQLLTDPAKLTEFVRERMLREVVLAEVKAAKWDERPEVIQRANDARDTAIVQGFLASRVLDDPNFPGDAEIAAAYAANKARFGVPKLYHVSQIALRVPAGATKEADDQARKRLLDLRQQLTKGKANFADLAKAHSDDKNTADKGGDLGWLPAENMLPVLRTVVTTLPENGISDVIRSPDAYHLLKLTGTRPPGTAPLEQVRGNLVQALRQNRTQQQIRVYLDSLLKPEPIQVFDTDLAQRVGAAP